MKFRRLPSPEDVSPYDSGWRYAVSVAAAILLLVLALCTLVGALDAIGVRR